MKVKFHDFIEMDVRARGLYGKRANNDDLTAVLNELSIVYEIASKNVEHVSIANDYKKKADALYQLCKQLGAYK